MITQPAPLTGPNRPGRPFFAVLTLLLCIYGIWFLTYWPGSLGEDSLAILWEAETQGTFESGKPVFWYYFVSLLYMPWRLVEIPIAVQLVITALVFSRILGWCWQQGLKRWFWVLLFFIAIAPHTTFFAATLYPDGIFAVTGVGLIFELWLLVRNQALSKAAACSIAICLPFALFARSNGFVLIFSIAYAAYACRGMGRWALIGYTVCWLGLIYIGGQLHPTKKHETLFPLAAFETANFLQPRAMGLWVAEPRVSEKSIQILSKNHPLERTIQFYDRDYWDPLVYFAGGPDLKALSDQDRSNLVSEFLTYNLWHNLPAFMGSRVNVFLVAGLAQGGFPSYGYSETILKRIHSKTQYRPFQLTSLEASLTKVSEFSFRHRWILWTPFLGLYLLVHLTYRAYRQKVFPVLAMTLPMVVQLVGIFALSPAGEYRYLLPFALLPMALIPMWESLNKNESLNS
jgi:hypothetical protein